MKSVTLTSTYYVPNSSNPVKVVEDTCIRNLDNALNAYNRVGNDVDLLKDELTGDRLDRQIAVHPHRSAVPPLVRTLMGSDALDYQQNTTYDFSTHQGTMTTHMTHPVMKKKIESSGTFSLQSNAPFNPDAVTYTFDGTIRVKVPGIGRVVEKTIVKELRIRSEKIEQYCQRLINAALAEAAVEAPVEEESTAA
jgi:hypothetical protein